MAVQKQVVTPEAFEQFVALPENTEQLFELVGGDCRTPLPYEGYNPLPSDLAIEVVSPTDSEKKLSIKIANYLAAGAVVWVVYPQEREVIVYTPGQAAQIVLDVLDGCTVLPGFRLVPKDIFPEPKKD